MRLARLAAVAAAPALLLAACADGTSPTAPAATSPSLGLVVSPGPTPYPCTIQACLGGGRIAFVHFTGGEAHIYTVSTAGFDTVRMDKDASFKRLVAWSPDYTKVAYVADSPGGGADIFTMGADGTNVHWSRHLSSGYVDALGWSPDGTKLVYSATSVNWQGDIFLMTAGGGAVWQLTNDVASDGHPAFSADGTRILFESTRGSRTGQPDVWSMNTAGGDMKRLTNTPEIEDDIHMSPDGTRLAYHAFLFNDGGGYAATKANKLVVSNADGTGAQVVQSVADGGAVEGLTWSRDGKYLAWAHTWDPWNTTVERWQLGSASAPVALTAAPGRRASPSWHF